jgi:hypothetical protein
LKIHTILKTILEAIQREEREEIKEVMKKEQEEGGEGRDYVVTNIQSLSSHCYRSLSAFTEQRAFTKL